MSWNWQLDYHRHSTAEFGSLASLASLTPARAPEPEFRWWQGYSGDWYVHTIFPFTSSTPVSGANYIFVRRDLDGGRTALYVGQSDDLRERLPRHEKFAAALRLGANELHVHLLAENSAERFRVETDLRNGHPAVLNEQGASYAKPMSLAELGGGFGCLAPEPQMSGLFGLGSPFNPYRR